MEDYEVLEGKLENIRTTTYCILFPVVNDDQCICLKPTSQRCAEFHNWDWTIRFQVWKIQGSSGRCPMGVEVSAINCALLRRVRLWWPTSP